MMQFLIKENDFENYKDYEFCHRIYEKGLTPYIERLKQYGFQNHGKILDAGCGFGQWSLSLSQLNQEVFSCDAAPNRIAFLKKIIASNKINNITATQGTIDNLAYDNDTFDAIFCYGVIFLTPWKKSLSELIRVLKPGGKLYVNANGLGWYKHLWYTSHNKTIDYDPQLIAAKAWLNTHNYLTFGTANFPCDIIIEPQELIKECEQLGLETIQWDGEGLLGNPNNTNIFFQKEYFGDVGVYELIGYKK